MFDAFRKSYVWWLLVIIIFGWVLRFIYLDRVPSGISDDELDYVLTAKSVYLTGKNLDGTFSPYSFRQPPAGAFIPSAKAPYMLLAPFIGTVKSSLAVSKIPYGVISLLTIVVLFFITSRLWDTGTALFTAFVLSVNPWSIFFGRTAFEAPLSVFCVYIFLFCLMYLRNWWLCLSLIPWFVGLYMYQGINIIYLPVLLIGVIGIRQLRRHEYSGPYLSVVILGIMAFSLFVLSTVVNGGFRLGELASPENPSIITEVNDGRRTSAQTSLNTLFINKYTVFLQESAGKYISAFSSIHLFVSGEDRSTFTLRFHGLFYPFEIGLLIIGLYTAYRKNRGKTIFLLSLIAVAPIPVALSTVGTSYALRGSLMYPLFCMFIGIGIMCLRGISRKKYIYTGIILMYLLFAANFLHIYLIRNPVNNSEGFGFGNRILSRYIALASANGNKILYAGNGIVNTYRQYIFYNDIMKPGTIADIQQSIRRHDYTIGSVRFIECPKEKTEVSSEYTVIVPFGTKCTTVTETIQNPEIVIIAQLNDNGRIFEIKNDKICKNYKLSRYQQMISFNDLDVENISAEKFCQTYISKPTPSL